MPIQHTPLSLTPTPSKRVQRLCLAGICLDLILLFQTGLSWIWELGCWAALISLLIHLLQAQQILQLIPLEDGRWRVVDRYGVSALARLKGNSVFCPMMIRLNFEIFSEKSKPCDLDPGSEAGEENKEAEVEKIGAEVENKESKRSGNETNIKTHSVSFALFPDSLPIRDYQWLLLWLKFQHHSQYDGPQCWPVWQALRAKCLSRYKAYLSRAPDLS